MNTVPTKVHKKIDEWLTSDFKILHAWTDDYDTWFVVCANEGKLYFLRIYRPRLGQEYELSQDNVLEAKP